MWCFSFSHRWKLFLHMSWKKSGSFHVKKNLLISLLCNSFTFLQWILTRVGFYKLTTHKIPWIWLNSITQLINSYCRTTKRHQKHPMMLKLERAERVQITINHVRLERTTRTIRTTSTRFWGGRVSFKRRKFSAANLNTKQS